MVLYLWVVYLWVGYLWYRMGRVPMGIPTTLLMYMYLLLPYLWDGYGTGLPTTHGYPYPTIPMGGVVPLPTPPTSRVGMYLQPIPIPMGRVPIP